MIKTDWNTVREAMNAAIDSCERLEQLGYRKEHRGLTVDVDGQPISVYEFLVSAWSMPELVKYHVIRQRHDAKTGLPYVPETARILTSAVAACAEVIGADGDASVEAPMRGMTKWYLDHFIPHIEKALTP
ncbi:MAG: hypothetical protein ACRYHA_31430 [Janthinobacterium lividum]